MIEALSAEERYAMAHAIGHHSSKSCRVHGGRNYYVTAADDPLWCGLVERGLAERSRATPLLPDGEACFRLTPEGIAAVERDPRSKPKGRRYSVRFKGSDHETEVWAESRSQARYRAALEVADAWNLTVAEALRTVESCRLG